MIHDLRFIVRDGKKILQRYMGNKALFSNPMQLVEEWADVPCVSESQPNETVATGEITLHFDGKESVRTVVERYNKTAPHGARLTVDGVEPIINNDDKILVTGQTNIPDGVYTFEELKAAKRYVGSVGSFEGGGTKFVVSELPQGVYVTKEMLAKAWDENKSYPCSSTSIAFGIMAKALGLSHE